MKVIIQIPCFNEEASLPITLAALPKTLPGVDEVEVLVVDDGSSDDTSNVAKAHGAHHVIGFSSNQGLARAFMLGIVACLERGADIVVNTDADNQYNAEDIAALLVPILEQRADLVIGTRPISEIEHFSPTKKLLQRLGSRVVAAVSGTRIEDAPSGFRAYSRLAASSVNVFSDYTYTLETIIQAGQKGLTIACVPVRVNADLRPSRLVRSIPSYVLRSLFTIVRIFVVYQPFKFLFSCGSALFFAGVGVGLRFLWYFWRGDGDGHVQSLILASVLLIMGFQTVTLAFVADLLSVNRRLLEELQAGRRFDKRSARAQREA